VTAPTGFGLGEQPLNKPVRVPVTVNTLHGQAFGDQIGAPHDGRVFVALHSGLSAWFTAAQVSVKAAPDGP
jgi:hypothetical protein